jgi:hypothetical protein
VAASSSSAVTDTRETPGRSISAIARHVPNAVSTYATRSVDIAHIRSWTGEARFMMFTGPAVKPEFRS